MLRPFDIPSQQCWEVMRHVEKSFKISFKLCLNISFVLKMLKPFDMLSQHIVLSPSLHASNLLSICWEVVESVWLWLYKPDSADNQIAWDQAPQRSAHFARRFSLGAWFQANNQRNAWSNTIACRTPGHWFISYAVMLSTSLNKVVYLFYFISESSHWNSK